MSQNLNNHKLSWLVSSCGCAWQLYYIFSTYFKYDTVVSVDLITDPEYEIPAITVCGFLEENENLSYMTISKMKNAKLKGNLTFKCEYLCYIDTPAAKCQSVSCEEITNVTVTYQWVNREIMKCYTYFERNHDKRGKMLRGNFYYNKMIYMINVSTSDADLSVLVHPRHNLYHIEDLKVDRFYTNGFFFKYGYTDTRYISLPAPYVTNCNYYTEFLGGIYECNQKCKIEWFETK